MSPNLGNLGNLGNLSISIRRLYNLEGSTEVPCETLEEIGLFDGNAS